MGRGVLALVALGLGLLWPAASSAVPASGPRETVDMSTSSTHPSTSAALGYAGRYHSATDPGGDPPALRRLVMELPAGTHIDTTVVPRCMATDMEIELVGTSACPAQARVGSGQATVKMNGLGATTYDTEVYNAPDDILELIVDAGRVIGVVHTYVRGSTLDGPVPTCATGGDPPSGCPTDQLTLLANHLQINAYSVGAGAARRNYGTTPPTCPSSGFWEVRVSLYFADGSVDHVTPRSPCDSSPSAAAAPSVPRGSDRRAGHRRTRAGRKRRSHRPRHHVARRRTVRPHRKRAP